ncbi:MAG: iron-containing alcohol dehydrogenase family protein [bacterium]|nr:iron-containing alcohol dehydrogenase family protein [bacterium]
MQGSTFPFLLEMVDLGCLDFEGFLARNELTPRRVRVITGGHWSKRIGMDFARRIRGLRVEFVSDAQNTLAFHERICAQATTAVDETLVVGLGGGAVLDLAKYHASSLGYPYLAIPTVISNDGIASPIAILQGREGTMVSYATAPPTGTLIDRTILARAPGWALVNGLGDVIANHSAVMDWDLAVEHGQAQPNALARIMSRSAVQNILGATPSLRDDAFFERYIDAIVLSGLAMYISGDSRPCSGAEHLIAHVITRDQPGRYGHGFLVGSIAPFIVWLHQRRDRSVAPLVKALRLEPDFVKLAGIGRSLVSLVEDARSIRGPRFTILDTKRNEELEVEYDRYLRSLDAPMARTRAPSANAALQ